MAQSGFLLSPLVGSQEAFAATAANAWDALEDLRVQEFRIDTLAETSQRFFGGPFHYSLAVLRLDPGATLARSARLGTLFASKKSQAAIMSPPGKDLVVNFGRTDGLWTLRQTVWQQVHREQPHFDGERRSRRQRARRSGR